MNYYRSFVCLIYSMLLVFSLFHYVYPSTTIDVALKWYHFLHLLNRISMGFLWLMSWKCSFILNYATKTTNTPCYFKRMHFRIESNERRERETMTRYKRIKWILIAFILWFYLSNDMLNGWLNAFVSLLLYLLFNRNEQIALNWMNKKIYAYIKLLYSINNLIWCHMHISMISVIWHSMINQ